MPSNTSRPCCSFFLFPDRAQAAREQVAAIFRQSCAIADLFVFCNDPDTTVFADCKNLTLVNYCPQTLTDKFKMAGLACGEFICLIANDFIPAAAWFEQMAVAQKHYNACMVQQGSLRIENPQALKINPGRDYWCAAGSGWFFFPANWLPDIIAASRLHGQLRALPMVCPAGNLYRKITLVSANHSAPTPGMADQPVKLILPGDHKHRERALLSIAGQHYQNCRCYILAPDDVSPATFKKLVPAQLPFELVNSMQKCEFHSGDIVVALAATQWLAHPDVLRQLNRSLYVCDKVLCPQVSFDQNGETGSESPGHPQTATQGCIACSPDLSFVAEEVSCETFSYANSPLPLLPVQSDRKPACALATVITPDYLPDALLSLGSYARNCQYKCDTYIFIAASEPEIKSLIKATLRGSHFHALFPDDLLSHKTLAKGMQRRYATGTNEYRWGMKSVVLAELLARGYQSVLHLDPDIYAVSDISDIHAQILNHALSVFPHFRDPDNAVTRKFLYQDGFFNGGMLGSSQAGLQHLLKLSERCLRDMRRDRIDNLFDDQKYYELFVLECDDLLVNRDKGINYSLWNNEPVEGLIGPSQRSFLLRSGNFVRIWHMHSDLVKSLGSPYAANPDAQPVIILYLLALLITSRILYIANPGITGLFEKRLGEIEARLANAAAETEVWKVMGLLKLAGEPSEQRLRMLVKNILASASFDNFELYAHMLIQLLPPSGELNQAVAALRANDYRYITESGRQPEGMDFSEVEAAQAKRARQIYGLFGKDK